ncbi:MAG: hypothetical protein WCA82_03580 [Jiangellales bacterium]
MALPSTIGDGVLDVTANTWGPGFDPSAGHGQLVAIDAGRVRLGGACRRWAGWYRVCKRRLGR